jgi:hypothetical protein
MLFQGRCPYCHQHAFIRREMPGLSTTLLCPGCYREYHVGAAVAELLHAFCPAARLKAVYGLIYSPAVPAVNPKNIL